MKKNQGAWMRKMLVASSPILVAMLGSITLALFMMSISTNRRDASMWLACGSSVVALFNVCLAMQCLFWIGDGRKKLSSAVATKPPALLESIHAVRHRPRMMKDLLDQKPQS